MIINKIAFSKYSVPAGLLLLNFILKVIYLDKTSIANDEPFSIYIAQMDVHSIVSQLRGGNNPPLFEIILHFWIRLFGISAFSTRFLPLLFSVATVFFIYKTGIDFFNEKVAVISGLLYTFSNYQIYFSHEVRVYSLFALLTAISMFAYFKLIENKHQKPYLVVLILVNILLIYAHFFGLFIPLIQLLCCIFFKEIRIKILKTYFIVVGFIILSYLPYLTVILTRFIDAASNGTWVQPSVWEDLYTMLWRFSNAPVTTVIFLIVLAGAFIQLTRKHFRGISIYGKVILFWFLFPYFLMFLVSMKYLPFNVPVFFDRYVAFISIGFYLTVAVSSDYLFSQHRYGSYLIFLPVAFIMITCKPDVDNKRHVGELMDKVKEIKTGETVTYFCPPNFDCNFVYYYNAGYFKDVNGTDFPGKMHQLLAQDRIYPVIDQDQIDTNLISHADKILFIDAAADFLYPENNIFTFLSQRFPKYKKYNFPEIFALYVFEN